MLQHTNILWYEIYLGNVSKDFTKDEMSSQSIIAQSKKLIYLIFMNI